MKIDIRDISQKWFASDIPQNFTPATATLGAGTNGTITVNASESTTDVVIEIVLGEAKETPMSAALEGGTITVTLGTTDADEPTADDTANTALLIAKEIDKIAGFSAVASGTGVTAISTVATDDVAFEDGEDGTPSMEAWVGFVSNGTYYVSTKADNSIYNDGWKKFTLQNLSAE